jgi:hypothetical protein
MYGICLGLARGLSFGCGNFDVNGNLGFRHAGKGREALRRLWNVENIVKDCID